MKIKRLLILVACLVCLGLITSRDVFAEEVLTRRGQAEAVQAEDVEEETEETESKTEESNDAPKPVLEISPVSKRMLFEPGEEKSSKITVSNNGEESLKIAVYVKPYSNGDNSDSQDFETQTNYTQISRWLLIKGPNGKYAERVEYTLAGGEKREIEYRVATPEDAPAGGQYATIFVEIQPSEAAEGMIQTYSRAGMVIYASVSGETRRSAAFSEIDSTTAVIGGNIGLKFTIKNAGNIDFQVSTDLKVSSVFGKELYQNSSLATVLPENSKTVLAEWADTPAFGLYRLDYSINALDLSTKGSQLVLVMKPFLFALFIVLFIAAIIAVIYLVKRRSLDKDIGITTSF